MSKNYLSIYAKSFNWVHLRVGQQGQGHGGDIGDTAGEVEEMFRLEQVRGHEDQPVQQEAYRSTAQKQGGAA